MQARVKVDNMRYGNANWICLHEQQVPEFSRIISEEIRDITIGVYQVQLAPYYMEGKLQRDDDGELQQDMLYN